MNDRDSDADVGEDTTGDLASRRHERPWKSPGAKTALRRAAEMAAIFMVGDGLLGLTQPVRHVNLWRSPHPAIDLLVRPFAGAPMRRRVYGAVQVALGLAIASRLRGDGSR